MPETVSTDRTKPALALSGGGFRATLFHIGTLCRLNELGMLAGLERISSVSGGSIAAGRLATRWSRLTSTGRTFTNLDSEVIAPLRQFCSMRVDDRAVVLGTLSPFSTIGDKLADIYASELVGGATLQDLPDTPQFVFNATNIQTGRLVRMQKNRLADYTIGQIVNPRVPVATAMAASSAFPPVLSPVRIACAPGDWQHLDGAVHFGDPNFSSGLTLMDGGAYDNLGLETVDDFATIIVSDAGAPFSVEEVADVKWTAQAARALDIATNQARSLRRRLLFAETSAAIAAGKSRVFTLASIDDEPDAPGSVDRFGAARVLRVDPTIVKPLARIRTRLTPFSDEEQGRLINWGWYLTDLAVRTRIAKTAPAPTQWLVPEWPLG